MFLPIGDEPNPSGKLPLVTIALIAINVAVFLLLAVPLSSRPPDPSDPMLAEYLRTIAPRLPAGTGLPQITAYDLVLIRWGFRPSTPNLITLLTAMFLHGGFMHVAGNMLYLWIYGNNVENRLGALGFLFWYLVTGTAATLSQMLLNPASPIPVVGASGAISGVLGFYLIWFPRNVVKVFVLLFPFYIGVVRVKAMLVLILFLLVDNLLPLLITRSEYGIAHGAHIGGFVVGAAVAWLMPNKAASSSE